ncbi:MAG TPA: hypothetical protein VJR27_02885 [Candidatus Saccharimonadales bacterium]|nr:hypothetical protein [Candidatus Saccharimonadales bacterium]
MAEIARIMTTKVATLAGLTLGVSVVLALVASFALGAWAEASAFGHGLQHVLLVVAGAGFGSSLVTIIKRKRQG